MSVDANTPTIPQQLYVTVKSDRVDTPLGFMSPYENNSAFRKRQQTQLNWAYQSLGHYSKPTFTDSSWHYLTHFNLSQLYCREEADGSLTMLEWVEDDSVERIDLTKVREQFGKYHPEWHYPDSVPGRVLKPVTNDHRLAPKIFDNTPIEGFEFTREVRRTYWGGGNVVWRVKDPRGFELEISSSNLAKIIDCSTIKEGVITEPCIWGRYGKDNVLIPISSEVYRNAQNKMANIEKSKKLSLKDVKLGDHVKLLNDDNVYEYFGSYNLIVNSGEYPLDSNCHYSHFKTLKVAEKTVSRYVLKNINTEKFIIPSTPKVQEIVKPSDKPITKEDLVVELNRLAAYTMFDDTAVLGFSIQKVNNVKLELVPVDYHNEDIKSRQITSYSSATIPHFFKENDKIYAVYYPRGKTVINDSYTPIVISDNKIHFTLDQEQGRYFNYQSKYTLKKYPIINAIDQLYTLQAIINDGSLVLPVTFLEIAGYNSYL